MVTAGIVIFNEAGDLLLQRRADDGSWGLIGGFMELGESLEAAARREVLEETGLTVGELELFGVFDVPGIMHTYDNSDEAQIITVTYRLTGPQAFYRRTTRGSSCAIFRSQPYPSLFLHPTRQFLRRFGEGMLPEARVLIREAHNTSAKAF